MASCTSEDVALAPHECFFDCDRQPMGRRLQIVPGGRRNNIITHVLNFFLRLFIVVAIVPSFALDANSIMATPSEFMPLESKDRTMMQTLIDKYSLPFGISDTFIRRFVINDKLEIIVARENDRNCIDDRCVTAIFSSAQKHVDLVMLGPLPRKVSLYDSADRLCQGCDLYYSLVFEGVDGYVTVTLAPGYVVWIEEKGLSE